MLGSEKRRYRVCIARLAQSLLILLLGASLAAPIEFAPKPGQALEQLGGIWRCLEYVEEGQALPPDQLGRLGLTIADDSLLMLLGDVVAGFDFRVDNGAAPSRIELVPTAGANRGRAFLGVYEIDGDELRLAYGALGEEAPSAPTADSAVRGQFTRWQRVATTSQDMADEILENSLGMTLRLVLPGTFVMGAAADESSRQDETPHRVTISRPLYVSAHEVTVAQFAEFVRATSQPEESPWKSDAERGLLSGEVGIMGGLSTVKTGLNLWDPEANWRNPGFEQTGDHPVVFVSWNDAVKFCEWLSLKEGKTYRLPTEAEWEYAARAGSQTAYWWGDVVDAGEVLANLADMGYAEAFPDRDFGLTVEDGYVHTSPVGAFAPNAFGLYDTHGNVFEWVHDYWSVTTSTISVDPKGPNRGQFRIAKGGGWGSHPDQVRSAFRFRESPEMRAAGLGFRVALDIR